MSSTLPSSRSGIGSLSWIARPGSWPTPGCEGTRSPSAASRAAACRRGPCRRATSRGTSVASRRWQAGAGELGQVGADAGGSWTVTEDWPACSLGWLTMVRRPGALAGQAVGAHRALDVRGERERAAVRRREAARLRHRRRRLAVRRRHDRRGRRLARRRVAHERPGAAGRLALQRERHALGVQLEPGRVRRQLGDHRVEPAVARPRVDRRRHVQLAEQPVERPGPRRAAPARCRPARGCRGRRSRSARAAASRAARPASRRRRRCRSSSSRRTRRSGSRARAARRGERVAGQAGREVEHEPAAAAAAATPRRTARTTSRSSHRRARRPRSRTALPRTP